MTDTAPTETPRWEGCVCGHPEKHPETGNKTHLARGGCRMPAMRPHHFADKDGTCACKKFISVHS
jgi:hypothetical protein